MPTTTTQSLFAAIKNDNDVGIRAMLSESPELIHAKDARGIDPLTLATYTNKLEVTKVLVESGADVNQIGPMGTPLMGVSFKGAKAIAEYLLDQGAQLDLENREGMTALMFAAAYGQGEMVKFLVAKGADTTKVDQRGFNAKEHAKAKGHADIAFLL